MAEDNRPFPEQSGMKTPTHNGGAHTSMMVETGNTVGSQTSLMTQGEAYVLGLWCADGYHRTSSIGLSNVNLTLIKRFARFLERQLGRERLRIRVYVPPNVPRTREAEAICDRVVYRRVQKAKHVSYHVYVNSRPLLRRLRGLAQQRETLPQTLIMAYFAGRFDGDGSLGADRRKECRITYGNAADAERDQRLLQRAREDRIQVYRYRDARTYVLYVSRFDAPAFVRELQEYSSILNSSDPVETEPVRARSAAVC